ncbi:MAG TPA: hypothetical protein VGH16_03265 [Candidatus Binatia bacterium]
MRRIISLVVLLMLWGYAAAEERDHPFFGELQEAYKNSKLTYNTRIEALLFRKLLKPTNELERVGQISQQPKATTKAEEQILDDVSDALTRQFFSTVRAGGKYCPVDEIKRQFGQTPEERLGISSGGYYRLFVAYWTLKAKLRMYQQRNISNQGYANLYNLDAVLSSLESGLAGAFFPTSGPTKIPESKHRQGIQDILRSYAPNMTIRELYEGADPQKVPWPILK